MAVTLALKGEIVNSQNCLSFQWKETTGGSGVSTGWGAFGNPTTADATAATLTVVLANGTSVVFSTSAGFYPLFPNTNSALFTITNVMLGLSVTTPITDFIAYITYTASVGAANYSFSKYFFVSCQSSCCLAKLNAAIDFDESCDCQNKDLDKFIQASALYDAIGNALQCTPQLPNKANALLSTLTDFCARSGSGCGCG